MNVINLNMAQAQAALDALEELREYAGLNERQLALMGDLRRALGIETQIKATLGQGRVTYLPLRIGGPRC